MASCSSEEENQDVSRIPATFLWNSAKDADGIPAKVAAMERRLDAAEAEASRLNSAYVAVLAVATEAQQESKESRRYVDLISMNQTRYLEKLQRMSDGNEASTQTILHRINDLERRVQTGEQNIIQMQGGVSKIQSCLNDVVSSIDLAFSEMKNGTTLSVEGTAEVTRCTSAIESLEARVADLAVVTEQLSMFADTTKPVISKLDDKIGEAIYSEVKNQFKDVNHCIQDLMDSRFKDANSCIQDSVDLRFKKQSKDLESHMNDLVESRVKHQISDLKSQVACVGVLKDRVELFVDKLDTYLKDVADSKVPQCHKVADCDTRHDGLLEWVDHQVRQQQKAGSAPCLSPEANGKEEIPKEEVSDSRGEVLVEYTMPLIKAASRKLVSLQSKFLNMLSRMQTLWFPKPLPLQSIPVVQACQPVNGQKSENAEDTEDNDNHTPVIPSRLFVFGSWNCSWYIANRFAARWK
eukprot:gnl/MRDRNA2_/MRDRNA2_116022_c0_seq1.p1 gnl/MRDRNA2_/MRDRNA2_116022_c0~~gnl/MRDRNA2_/MRDRNA2_116022_c0_seq1.p1  ORF type:complete len:466 (-),score=90.10 gnl/MRDRNA2_/MRDRNA2_116022_c0_seq1:181-1578(-)